jgi:hypothetical protein
VELLKEEMLLSPDIHAEKPERSRSLCFHDREFGTKLISAARTMR